MDQLTKPLPLYRIGFNLQGYGVGIFLGDFIYRCWQNSLTPRLDMAHVRAVGNDLYRGIYDRVLENVEKTGFLPGSCPVEIQNGPRGIPERFERLMDDLLLQIRTGPPFHPVFENQE